MQMQRTTISLPQPLMAQIQWMAEHTNKSFSAVITELLGQAMGSTSEARTEGMYTELAKLQGVGPAGITDASTTINETLYNTPTK